MQEWRGRQQEVQQQQQLLLGLAVMVHTAAPLSLRVREAYRVCPLLFLYNK